jgi:hypothetical protein
MTDDLRTGMASETIEDVNAALEHLGWQSVEDLHYWAKGNDIERFEALVQRFAKHRHAAITHMTSIPTTIGDNLWFKRGDVITDAHFIRLQQVMREWQELRYFKAHMQSDAMKETVGDAVFDPGKFAGMRGNDETMRQWTARAVLSAIGEHHAASNRP